MPPLWTKLLLFVISAAPMLMLEEPIAAPLKESNTDLALVLAVDLSSSVDDIEFAIQLRGIASAFRQVAIVEAIKSGPNGRIDVVLLVWSGEIEQSDRSEWTRISCESEALDFANQVELFPRRVRGETSVGNAIMASVALLRQRAGDASRLSIDISGDGRETVVPDEHSPNQPIAPAVARLIATKFGITINALAIQTDERDLANWYSRDVITADGFVLAVEAPEAFADAILRKLVREIRQPLLTDSMPDRSDHFALAIK